MRRRRNGAAGAGVLFFLGLIGAFVLGLYLARAQVVAAWPQAAEYYSRLGIEVERPAPEPDPAPAQVAETPPVTAPPASTPPTAAAPSQPPGSASGSSPTPAQDPASAAPPGSAPIGATPVADPGAEQTAALPEAPASPPDPFANAGVERIDLPTIPREPPPESALSGAASGVAPVSPPAPPPEIVIEDIRSRLFASGDIRRLLVSGRIVNPSDGPIMIPDLEVTLTAGDGRELQSWVVRFRGAVLDAGEGHVFETSVDDPPREATSLNLTIVGSEGAAPAGGNGQTESPGGG